MARKYTQKNLLDAVNAVRQGLSYRKAYKKYGVPVMTLQNRVSGQVDDLSKPGRPVTIPEEIEEKIVAKLKQAATQGFGITRRMLAVRVGRVVRRLGVKTPFRNGVPGKDWINGFLKRHRDISLRSPMALSTVRARMLNKTVTDKYYETLSDLLRNLNLNNKPAQIWNIDESSVPLTHKPSKVVGPTGAKNIPGRVGNSRDNVSVLACINAAGGTIPPMCIVKGKTYKSLHAYNTKLGVTNSVFTFQEKAWMEDALGEMWFSEHFLKYCGPERPQLILLDSHSSHETLGLIDAAIENDIALLAFPPHTTQWLCPLDKTVFGPLSREYSRVCSEFMADSPNNIITKWEWPGLFRLAYEHAFSVTNIVNGFKKCGIFPTNPGALPSVATSPSEPFDIAASTSVPCKTPSPCIDSAPGQSHKAALSDVSAAHGNVLSHDEFIKSVLSGDVPCSVDEFGNLNIEVPVDSNVQSQTQSDSKNVINAENIAPQPTSSQWSSEVDGEFSLPMSNRPVKVSSRKLTSHRILTSDDIYNKKKQEFEKKEKLKQEKEERKMAKLLKKESKLTVRKASSKKPKTELSSEQSAKTMSKTMTNS